MRPIVGKCLPAPILAELLSPVPTRVIAPGVFVAVANTVVGPFGGAGIAWVVGIALTQQVELRLLPVGVDLGSPFGLCVLRLAALPRQAIARRIDVPARLLLGLQAAEHGAQAPRRVVAVALGVTWRLDGDELAQRVVVVLTLCELADQGLRGCCRCCLHTCAVQGL